MVSSFERSCAEGSGRNVIIFHVHVQHVFRHYVADPPGEGRTALLEKLLVKDPKKVSWCCHLNSSLLNVKAAICREREMSIKWVEMQEQRKNLRRLINSRLHSTPKKICEIIVKVE